MFGFDFSKQRDEASKFLARQMNRSCIKDFKYGNRRESRGYMMAVAWVIPFEGGSKTPNYAGVFSAITRDVGGGGMSIVHSTPITSSRLLIGFDDDTDQKFVEVKNTHCTRLGYGFYQIGLQPLALQLVEPRRVEEMRAVLEQNEAAANGGELAGAAR